MALGTALATVFVVAAAASLGGCSGGNQPAAAETVTLTLTTFDAEATPGGKLVNHFIDEVEQLDPSITIEAHFSEAAHEPDAVTAVSDGTADLAMVASRAFDTAGVTTLQALNTPFLIDSNVLANAVATSAHVEKLLSGLEDIGVIGLAIAPEGLRHLFADTEAPVDVRDLEGAVVRSPQSEAIWSFLSAARATPIFDDSRRYDVAESQYDQAPLDKAAGNVTLFPKYDVLALNEKAAQQLSSAQRDALVSAATDATVWAVAHVRSDTAMARAFCAHGGEIAAASPEQLHAWRAVAKPVVDGLATVRSTSDLIEAFTQMKAGIRAEEPLTRCPDRAGDSARPRLNGTYSFEATVAAFHAVGIHDQGFIDLNAGDYTMTLRNGSLTRLQRFTSGPRAGESESDTVAYTLQGDTLTFRWSPQPSDFTTVTVTVLPDGSLDFSGWVEGLSEPKFLLADRVVLRHWERVG